MRREIARFTVNGNPYEVLIQSHITLLEVLRDQLGLTGTKGSCGVGECGTCTVLIDGKSVLACLTLAVTAAEKDIVTIEGLARGDTLHPVQRAFVDHGAIQCGFCSPGMILSAKALLDENPHPTREEVKAGLAGNLCRCAGYLKIMDAVASAAETMRKEGR